MVNSCVAIDCTNCYRAGSGISFHRFPHSKPGLLQKWPQSVKRINWKPNKCSFICSVHLEPSCFKLRAGESVHKLCNDALSSVFPSFPINYQKQKAKRKPQQTRELAPSPSKVARTVVSEHSYASNQEKAQENVKQPKREMEVLKQKVCWQKKYIKSMKDLMKNLKEKSLVSSHEYKLLAHNFNGISKELFENQVCNAEFRDKHSNQYSEKWNSLQGPFTIIPQKHMTLFTRFFCCHIQQVSKLGQHQLTVSLAISSTVWGKWGSNWLYKKSTSRHGIWYVEQ